MAVKQTKKASDLTTVTSMSSTQYLTLTDASGNLAKISLASLKASLLGGISLEAINEGVYIAYHRKSDDCPVLSSPEAWSSRQSAGEIADGVLVIDGGKMLMVAPTEASSDGLPWSSAGVSGGGVTTTDRIAALSDWEGKANTANQITHAECSGTGYAPGFCAAYSRANANGKGILAGSWWLPSLGQAVMMMVHIKKINYALSFISGAVLLPASSHWASTELSKASAWYLYLGDGFANAPTKASTRHRVRPVSAFIK